MKTLADKIFLILLACVIGLAGCQEEFEDKHGTLALDYTRFNLNRESGEFAFMVYFDGDWTITLDKEVDWVELEMTSGRGVTPVHFKYEENLAFKRSFTMTISGGEESRSILVSQKPAVEKPVLRFVEEPVTICSGSYRVKTLFQSNLDASVIGSSAPEVNYDMGGEGWLSNFEVRTISDDYVVEDGTAVYTYHVCFDIAANDSGSDRRATVSYYLYDEDGGSYSCETAVVQNTETGTLEMRESTVRGCTGKEYSEAIDGGLGRFDEEISCEVSYTGGDSDFISGVRVSDSRLYYTLAENTGTSERSATITLKFGDTDISESINVVQKEAGVKAVY